MISTHGAWKGLIGLLALLTLFTFCGKADAWHLHDQPFGFRLSITQNRNGGFTPVAHPVFSVNPAGDDYLREAPYTFTGAGGGIFEFTGLEAGGLVSSASAVGYFRPESAGTFLGV